jgi:hypothetical protein
MKTLVIHPQDRSTDFLKPIYENVSNAIILNGGATKDQVRELITQHDRIIMLGHGSPNGLFTVGKFTGTNGYIIDHTMVDALKDKECISIWCYADQFMNKHWLYGFYSGMFISEVGEATVCGLLGTSQTTVDTSNNCFAQLLGEVINESLSIIYNHVKVHYGYLIEENPVAAYNHKRLTLAEQKSYIHTNKNQKSKVMKKSTLIAEFDQTAHEVSTAFPSLYTKEDVIKVLRDLEETLKSHINDEGSDEEEEETVTTGLTKDQVQEIADAIASEFTNEGTDLISDYDLSMSCREVELDSVEFDEDEISKIAKRAIEGVIDYIEDNA